MALADLFLFLREWLHHPGTVAAIKPSGQALAHLITKDLSAQTGSVLELGPGTGVFTQAMLDRGVREDHLTLIEYSAEFVKLLRDRFPSARTLQLDAEQIDGFGLYKGSPVGAVICGLGLLNMSTDKIANIMKGAFTCIRPGGEFFLFTYGPRCPVPSAVLSELGLIAERVGRAYMNIPPAAVYRIKRNG